MFLYLYGKPENETDFEFVLKKKFSSIFWFVRKLKRTIKLTCTGALRQTYFLFGIINNTKYKYINANELGIKHKKTQLLPKMTWVSLNCLPSRITLVKYKTRNATGWDEYTNQAARRSRSRMYPVKEEWKYQSIGLKNCCKFLGHVLTNHIIINL